MAFDLLKKPCWKWIPQLGWLRENKPGMLVFDGKIFGFVIRWGWWMLMVSW